MKTTSYDEIEHGMSADRLGEVFGLDRKTVKSLLAEIEPDGDRRGVPFWHISAAAPYLVTPEGDIETYIKRLKPGDLPPKFTKEFWAALNLRTKYYRERGDLWTTERVYSVIATVLKTVRSTSRLFVDELESNTKLTTPQRDAIQREMDRMLDKMNKAVKEAFKDYDPTKDHVESIGVSENAARDRLFDEDGQGTPVDGEEIDADDWLYS